MVLRPRCSSRRGTTLLIVVLALLVTVLGPVRPSTAEAGSRTQGPLVDARLTPTECTLLGRRFVPGAGCHRRQCVKSDDYIKPSRNAEVCYRGGRGGTPYATFVPAPACRTLGRVWIDEVNVCASNPYRGPSAYGDSPLCAQAGRVYVNHTEEEGNYDECLTRAEFAKFDSMTPLTGETINAVAARMSRRLCSLRPGAEFTPDGCRPARTPPADLPASGTLVVGDSIAWRGGDELQDLHPDWVLDGRPGRTANELDARVRHYLLGHPPPQALIVALGANPGRRPTPEDYTDAIRLLPDSTRLVLVTPYRQVRSHYTSRRRLVEAIAGGMRQWPDLRPHTCVADWAVYAAAHPAVLLDDVHPTSPGESRWAEFMAASWTACPA